MSEPVTPKLIDELVCTRNSIRVDTNSEWQPWEEWWIGTPNLIEGFGGGCFRTDTVTFVTKQNAEAVIAAEVTAAKLELKNKFIALCKDNAEDAHPHTSYRLALEDLIESLENSDEDLIKNEPFEAFYPFQEQAEELGELLFQLEYGDDAKKLMYPKNHFERMARGVLTYIKDNSVEAELDIKKYRDKFLVADERAIEWQKKHEELRLHYRHTEELLQTARNALMPFVKTSGLIPAGYPDDRVITIASNNALEFRSASEIANKLFEHSHRSKKLEAASSNKIEIDELKEWIKVSTDENNPDFNSLDANSLQGTIGRIAYVYPYDGNNYSSIIVEMFPTEDTHNQEPYLLGFRKEDNEIYLALEEEYINEKISSLLESSKIAK